MNSLIKRTVIDIYNFAANIETNKYYLSIKLCINDIQDHERNERIQ